MICKHPMLLKINVFLHLVLSVVTMQDGIAAENSS
jgi:hypothetical protein